MNRQSRNTAILLTFLGATALTAPARADSHDSSDALAERVAQLEALVEKLAGQLSTQEILVSEQRERLDAAEPVIADTAAKVEKAPVGKSDGFTVGATNVKMGGYVKADMIALKNTGGDTAASGSIVRDFYIPSTVPVGGPGSDWALDFSARQTRFFFTTDTKLDGKTIGTRLELDFMVTGGGDERISNSYVPRLRHAFVTYDGLLAGQTWSTFQDVGSLPDSVDFIGTTEGTVFIRQPMVRYTNGPFQIALEQPETTVTTDAGARVLSGSDPLPDLVLRYNHKGDWGHVTLAAIGRSLNLEGGTLGLTADDSAFGYGASLSGKLKLGANDDFRFMATAGEGLGRYIGLNIANDAAVDVVGQSLEPIGTFSGFAAYRHVWDAKARSSLMFSYFNADTPTQFTGAAPTDEVWSLRGNFIYSPRPKLDFGLEYGYSERTTAGGLDGAQHRLQFTSKFAF